LPENSDFFLVAEVFGLSKFEGYVSVRSYSDFPDRFFDLKKVYIDVYGRLQDFFIDDVKVSKNNIQIKFVNFETSAELDFLIGCKIFVSSENVVLLGKDEYFIHDLIGSTVVRNGEFFGIIEDVLCLPANDVYVIKDKNEKEVLIAAVKTFIKGFDSKEKVLELTSETDIFDDDEN